MSESIKTVLALDLSLSTGWCITNTSDTPTYRSGKWKLRNTDPISRIISLQEELYEALTFDHIDLIVFERVDFSKFLLAYASYNQLLAMVYLFANATNTPLYGVPTGTLKKYSTGNGGADKEAMVAKANEIWYPEQHFDVKADNDEVDARLLAKLAIEHLVNPLLAVSFKANFDTRNPLVKEKKKRINKKKNAKK